MKKLLLLFAISFYLGLTSHPESGMNLPQNVFDITKCCGAVADAVDASSCLGDNPPLCIASLGATVGSGTDNTTAFAAAVDAAHAAGGGEIFFPRSGTNKYRLEGVIDEDDITVRCADGVELLPPFDDANGGEVLLVESSGKYVDGTEIDCDFRDDDPNRNHPYYTILSVATPSGGASGAISAAADYNAVVCSGTCGQDDINFVGTYTGGGVDQDSCGARPNADCAVGIEFEIDVVDAAASPETFRWKRNGGKWSETMDMSADSADPIDLIDGMSVYWDSVTGHANNDLWTIIQTPTDQSKLTSNAHGLGGQETIEIYNANPSSWDGTYIVGYVDANNVTIRTDYVDDQNETFTSGSFRQVPGIGEDVDYTVSGVPGGSGFVVRYDEANDILILRETSGTIVATDTIEYTGGAEWSVVVSSVIEGHTATSLMGGVRLARTSNTKIRGTFTDFGGTSLDIGSPDAGYRSIDTDIQANFYNCPSIPGKDACFDVRESERANFHDSTFDGGVAAGYAGQCIGTIAVSGSATDGAIDTYFNNDTMFDSSALDPAGPLATVDCGLGIAPNADGVDISGVYINGGSISVRQRYDDLGRGTLVDDPGAVSLGSSYGRLLNFVANGTKFGGGVNLNRATPGSVVTLTGGFTIDAALGIGLMLKGNYAHVGPGKILNAPSGAISLIGPSGDHDLAAKAEFSDLDIINTGVGMRAVSNIGQVYISSSWDGSFSISGSTIVPAPSSTIAAAGVYCSNLERTNVLDTTVVKSLGPGVRDCSSAIGNELRQTTRGIWIHSGTDRAVLIGNRIYEPQTQLPATTVCIDMDGDDGIAFGNRCYSDDAIAIDEAGNRNVVTGNYSADVDGSATGGTFDCDGTGSYCFANYALGGVVPSAIGTAVRSGAAPTECREVGQLFYDTDETDDTNCTTTADNVMCRCTAVGTPGTWVTTETD